MASKRILVIDDERLTRISLADFLEEAGFDTATASDGETALQLQRERPFDLCIVDIRMPDLDGVDTILALQHMTPHCQFIIYTGSPQFTLPLALENLGLTEQHVVRKPIIDMGIFTELIGRL
ncbi:MAG: response regulator [Anaerolineae bacterium]|nr:response regulator [Anaerolineae bacterium]